MKRTARRRISKAVPLLTQLESAVSQAITWLDKRQLPHGEFRTLAATDESLVSQCRLESSLFVTALVVHAIGASRDPRVSRMIERGLDFFATQMKGAGLWSYWSTHSKLANYLPVDLDDTCCISFLMLKYARPFPANRPLVLANRSPEGLFYTWLVARAGGSSKSLSTRMRDRIGQVSDPAVELVLSLSGTLDNIDCAVNANVLLYLGQDGETQAAVDYLVEKVQEDGGQACGTFYPDPLALYYFISRAYANGVSEFAKTRKAILARLASRQLENGSFGPALFTALAACTFLNFDVQGTALDDAVSNLLGCQNGNGSWARHAMFLGPAPYYGSEDLTTAFCVEALSKYRNFL